MRGARRAAGPLVGVVLAAGRSARMGGPKALARLDGEPFVARVARTLCEGGCGRVVLVLAEPHGARVRAAAPGAAAVWNDRPERGQLSSLKLGLRAAAAHGCAGAVVALLDHPRVAAETVAALVAEHRVSGALLVRPVHAGRGGHPYVIDARAFDAVWGADDGAGARPVLRALTPARVVEVSDPAIHEDLDTPEDVRAAGGRPPDR